MTRNSCLPLTGKTIVLTRSQENQKEFINFLSNKGAQILDLPVLHITAPDNWDPLDKALKSLDEFDWIIFSSGNGVRNINSRMNTLGISLLNRPKKLKIAAVGKKTSQTLSDIGIKVDFVPPKFVADSLIDHFPKSKEGLKLLLPRVQSGGRNILYKYFLSIGYEVVEVAAYESRCPSEIPQKTLDALIHNEVDVIAFTSSKTVMHTKDLLVKYFGDEWLNKIKGVKIISIGPQTSLSCLKILHKVDKEAEPHDLEGLMKACSEIFKFK